ncbi:MAG: hypothetical protein V4582_09135 [Pseudomonadota bacterium]
MIILSTPGGSGINALFPILVTDKHRSIPVVEWQHYRRCLPFFLLANSAIAIGFSVLMQSPDSAESMYAAMNFLLLAYVCLRLKFGRRLITIDTAPPLQKTVAPFTVWLDYVSMGAMFVMMATSGLRRTDSEFMVVFFICMKYFYIAYSLLPALNYLKFRTISDRI